MRIRLESRSTMRVLLYGMAGLSVIGLAVMLVGNVTEHGRLLGLRATFHLSDETSIPTWFSSIILLISAGLLALIALAERANRSRYARHWAALSLIFAAMSIDEMSAIHERIGTALEIIFNSQHFADYGWVVPGLIVVVLVVAAFLPFVLALPRDTRRLFIISAVIFVGGASGMEAVGRTWEVYHGIDNVPYSLMVTVEETLEMLGVIIFIYALMTYIAKHVNDIHIRIDYLTLKPPLPFGDIPQPNMQARIDTSGDFL